MQLKGKLVSPDRRKGLIYVYQTDDSLMHFCWKDRTTGTVEEDLIVFPEDCEYQRIKQCTTGRVFALKFRSTSRRLFFWLQEPKTDKDDEYCRKINDLLNNPPTPGSHSTPSRGAGGSSGLSGELRDSELQSILGNISQQQLMQILGNNMPSSYVSSSKGSSSTTATTAASSAGTTSSSASSGTTTTASSRSTTTAGESSGTSRQDPIQLSDLQTILSGMMTRDGAAQPPKEEVDLSLGMTAEALQPILSDAAFIEKLTPYLPQTGETMPPAEQLMGTVSSPQFQQAVSLFSHALQTGELGPLVTQFGLGDEAAAAAASADLEAFVKALGKKENKPKEDKKDDKEDENMAVD